MARQARQKSSTGIYHIILRGINRQVIFEDDEDREQFIDCLHRYKGSCQYSIYGFCLMDNHIHLIIKENQEDIASIMKKVGIRFVAWYNRKYNRCGHLFQDRFKSEVIESDAYLLVVLRYIHQNPFKAGRVNHINDFKWSSYSEYIDVPKVVDTEFVLTLFAPDREQAMKQFTQFMSEPSVDTSCMEYTQPSALTDPEARLAIQEYAEVQSPLELQSMDKEERDKRLRNIKEVPGISTRQIARLTGISQSVVTRA